MTSQSAQGEFVTEEEDLESVQKPVLSVQAPVRVPVEAAKDWFLSLEEHPERYSFDTHLGFEFEQGSFGQPGARFSTRETFLFLTIELLFELADVGERTFSFSLVRPSALGVWGRFEIEGADGDQSLLSLHIGSETRLGHLLLRCYLLARVIHRQISAEVRHIRRSMERVHGD